ncbi:hypothetical protein [Streptomyces albidoflavus]|uniref:hypothetical protein n=1 Tax=Streptomyces albidoflavus TaxID=1886 RepID=UPI00386C54BF|nr:hypothetical protein OH730_31315 [Streptomyces albidoflavus]WTD86096.1 hypothetical protein OHA92_30690 [Streptomyces albidoflavus]
MGVLKGDDDVFVRAVAGADVGALDVGADADGDVLGLARVPGGGVSECGSSGEVGMELVDDGLVLGGDGPGGVAAAAAESTEHRSASWSG